MIRIASLKPWRVALALAAPLMLFGGCSEDGDLVRKNYSIQLDAGHVHIFSEKALVFTVLDLDNCTNPDDTATCAAVPGLDVTAFYTGPHSSRTREYGLEAGVLEDNGDGTYTWTRTFGDLGAHSVGLWFSDEGERYFASFPLETNRAGGERYFCDVDGGPADYAYQVRWNASSGHMHAGSEPVEFFIELKRSFNTPINTEQPWTNRFDHLRPLDIDGAVPTVRLTSGDTQISLMTMSYGGTGLYTASHIFADGDDGEYWLHIQFADDLGCEIDTAVDREEYAFQVVAPH